MTSVNIYTKNQTSVFDRLKFENQQNCKKQRNTKRFRKIHCTIVTTSSVDVKNFIVWDDF